MVGPRWFTAPTFWDISQEDAQWWAYMLQTTSAGTQELHLVPGIQVTLGGRPHLRGKILFPPSVSDTSYPSADSAFRIQRRPGILPPWPFQVGPSLTYWVTPQSRAKQELVVPLPPCPGTEIMYLMANNLWGKGGS